MKKLLFLFACFLLSQASLFGSCGVKIISSIARASKPEAASVALCLYKPVVHTSLLNLEVEQKRIERIKDIITVNLVNALSRGHEKHLCAGRAFIRSQQQYSTKKELDAHMDNYHVCASEHSKIFAFLLDTIDVFSRQQHVTDDEVRKGLARVLAEIKKYQPINAELSPIKLESAHKCLKGDQQ